ncbi:MAG: hypothetical protein AB7R89_34040 [Dehalococcoidia bacterium]
MPECHLVYFFKYREGFDDAWYEEQWLQRELSVPGVVQTRSWKTIFAERQAYMPPNEYDRMTEVRFANQRDAEAALCNRTSLWRVENREGLDRFEGIVVGPKPEYNLLADVPPQQYPFMTMPLAWRTGQPPDVPPPNTTNLVRYMYFFKYRDDVDIRLGEEWYLGHHTREGKQLPGIQTYITWRHRPLTGLRDAIPEIANFSRYTEIGYESIEYQQRAVNFEGPHFVPSIHYRSGVAWDTDAYRNFYIPEDPDILLRSE